MDLFGQVSILASRRSSLSPMELRNNTARNTDDETKAGLPIDKNIDKMSLRRLPVCRGSCANMTNHGSKSPAVVAEKSGRENIYSN